MRKLFVGISLIISTSALADTQPQGVFTYKVVQANFSAQHVHNATDANVVLNYDKKEVSLNIERAFYCPPGLFCSQVMPLPLQVNLPIISVKVDDCGIRTITALRSGLQADGAYQKMTIKDTSDMNCMAEEAVSPEATYITSYFDCHGGEQITDESKMVLSLISKN